MFCWKKVNFNLVRLGIRYFITIWLSGYKVFPELNLISIARSKCTNCLKCRDTFSRPPCTLVQPSELADSDDVLLIPDFGTVINFGGNTLCLDRKLSLEYMIEFDVFLLLLNPGKDFCPPIYPLGDQQGNFSAGVPLISLHSLQLKPSPSPPILASTTVINCQPLMVFIFYSR